MHHPHKNNNIKSLSLMKNTLYIVSFKALEVCLKNSTYSTKSSFMKSLAIFFICVCRKNIPRTLCGSRTNLYCAVYVTGRIGSFEWISRIKSLRHIFYILTEKKIQPRRWWVCHLREYDANMASLVGIFSN